MGFFVHTKIAYILQHTVNKIVHLIDKYNYLTTSYDIMFFFVFYFNYINV